MARPKIIFPIYSMTPDNRMRLQRQIGTLEGSYRVELAPTKPTRSTRQNAWYWGCIVSAFWEFCRDQDYTIGCEDESHEFLKARFLATSVVNRQTGEVIGRRVRSTTELTTEEMADYCEKCRAFLAEWCNVVVPDPDPAWSSAPSKGVAAAS